MQEREKVDFHGVMCAMVPETTVGRWERIEAAAAALVGGPGAVVECSQDFARVHLPMAKFRDLLAALRSEPLVAKEG